MERYQLAAAPRDLLGKQKVKRVRREGFIPAVIYGRGMEPAPLQVLAEDFAQMVKQVGTKVLVDLTIEGSAAPVTVVVKKIQRNPITSLLLNIDFHQVSVTDTISNRVPLELTGEPRGIIEGGTLRQPIAEVEIRGLAGSLPTAIQADVSHLGVGENLHVRDLVLPEGVECLSPADEVVASVHAPVAAVEEPVPADQITEPDLQVKSE